MTVQSSWQNGNTKAAMLEMSDGALIEIFDFGTSEPEERPRWLHLAVIVDDVDAVYEKALQCGAATDRPPFDVPDFKGPGTNLRLAFVKGPDGELIELYQEDQ
jgi:glyoxylase I family protein